MTTPLATTRLQSRGHKENLWGWATNPGSQTPEPAPVPTHKEPIEGSSVKGQISERWALPVGAAFRLVVWDPQEEMHFRSQTSKETHHI